MFGECRHAARHNSHQGQFEKKRTKERRWEQSVESIASTEKVRKVLPVVRGGGGREY